MPDLFVLPTFTICKIEAGKALLISEENYEMIEFPVKLLQNKKVNERVQISVDECKKDESAIKSLVESVVQDYGISSVEVERLKEEISRSNEFLKIERLGSTAAILSWKRGISSVFGRAIVVHSIDLEVSSCASKATPEDNEKLLDEYVEFVLRGLERIGLDDVMTRLPLPISLKCNLLIRTSAGSFRSNSIQVPQGQNIHAPMEDFSKLFLVTDLDSSDSRLTRIRELGGYIEREIKRDQPVTAVVFQQINNENSGLFEEAIESNLPVVGVSWLESLLSTNELPHFEDHLLSQ
jgi:hypothetical protein